MRKLIKRVVTISIVILGIFIAWCFLSDDEEYESNNFAYEESGNSHNGSSSGGSLSNGNSVSISETHSQSKLELISNGKVREPLVQLKGNGEDTVTILLYMNGSNLESDDQAATSDLQEMIEAGSSDKVNLIAQTMGTKKWSKKYGIASDRSQRYRINGDGLTLLQDDLGQLDCTTSKTLEDFVKWGVANYPADRYILLFWNHGGGPIYGFGYDEWNDDEYACLSVDEMQTALKEAGVVFDFIGMDCCIMSCMEVGCALYDYCDYLVLSEDFESGIGWEYTDWLKKLYNNTSIPTTELGQSICDEMVDANLSDRQNGDESIMALIDVSMMKVLYTAWKDFAYANENSLLNTNYSEHIKKKSGGRLLPSIENRNKKLRSYDDDDFSFFDIFYFGDDDYQMSDYYVTDIMAVAQNIDSDESEALSSAVGESLLYVRTTSGDSTLTGISVTLPYGDSSFYSDMKKVFKSIGFDNDYINWLSKFTSVSNNVDSYDYSQWGESWEGWDEYEDDYDWNDWEHYDENEEQWEDDFGWDDFGYDQSFNSWWDDNSDCYDDGCYEGDDFYYDDCYYEDDYYWFLW